MCPPGSTCVPMSRLVVMSLTVMKLIASCLVRLLTPALDGVGWSPIGCFVQCKQNILCILTDHAIVSQSHDCSSTKFVLFYHNKVCLSIITLPSYSFLSLSLSLSNFISLTLVWVVLVCSVFVLTRDSSLWDPEYNVTSKSVKEILNSYNYCSVYC